MKVILLFVLAVFTVFVSSRGIPPEEQSQFLEFQDKFNKKYSHEEYLERFEIFKSNLGKIEELNLIAINHKADTKFGVNKFADLSSDEFKNYYLNNKEAIFTDDLPVADYLDDEFINSIPTAFDWRTRGAVTPVKNQGQCGSCWSFSTTGNVEGQHFISQNKLVSLSEQNLVDCDHECMEYEGEEACDEGCNGGLQPNAYNYIIKNGGIQTESSYPYTAETGTQCNFNSANIGAKISNFTMIPKNETVMAGYIVSTGPLAIAADAVEWQFYIGGVFDIPCNPNSLDHGILIVGYSAKNTIFRKNMPYWIVKNSWGADWGEQGYIYLRRGKNTCGVSNFVSTSII
nr:cysteine proteinase I precursor [Dictyostelium discoideum]